MTDRKSDMIEATGLWENTTKSGQTYLSGSLGGLRVLIFPVKERKGERSPTHRMLFAPNERRETQGQAQTGYGGQPTQQRAQTPPQRQRGYDGGLGLGESNVDEELNDQIPFAWAGALILIPLLGLGGWA